MDSGKAYTESCLKGCLVADHTRKLLPCFHVFCVEYLREFNMDKPPKKYACPRCQVKFMMPKGDLNNLPGNFFGRRLEELNGVLLDENLKAESETETRRDMEMECGVCSAKHATENSTMGTSVAYCLDCHQYLCETCFGCHSRMRLSRTHQVLRVGDCFQSVAEVFSSRDRSCEAHPSEKERLYCVICEVPMCTECYSECHSDHRFVPVARMSEEAKTTIIENLHRIENAKIRAKEFLELVGDKRKHFVENVEQMEKKINQLKEQMLVAVSTTAQRQQEELNNYNYECTRQVSILENEVHDIGLDLEQLECMMIKVKDLVPNSVTPQVAENLSWILLQLTIPPGFRERQESWLQSPPRADHYLSIVDETLNDDIDVITGKIGELEVWLTMVDDSGPEEFRGDDACQGLACATWAEDGSTIDQL